MGIAQSVERELIFFASHFFEPAADGVGEVEGISEDGEGNVTFLEQG